VLVEVHPLLGSVTVNV
jgi:hypothetical protein